MQNLTFLFNMLINGGIFTYKTLIQPMVSWCRRYNRPRYGLSDFIPACQNGNLTVLQDVCSTVKKQLNLNDGLGIAVTANQTSVVKYLIEQGATNINDCLKVACANNHYDMVELLVQKGADILIVKRLARSPNILRMVFRYEQKTDVIN